MTALCADLACTSQTSHCSGSLLEYLCKWFGGLGQVMEVLKTLR